MRQLVLIVLFFPLLAFLVAGAAELRSGRNASQKIRALIPILLGIAAFGLSLDPQGLLQVNADSSITLSRVMTIFSAAVACSGVFINYSRRSSAVWVACGGLLLSISWMFNRIKV